MRLLAILLLLSCGAFTWADNMRPASLTIQAIDDKTYAVSWIVPLKKGKRPSLAVEFDNSIKALPIKRSQRDNNTVKEYWDIEQEVGLEGSSISIIGLKGSSYEVLLRIIDLNNQTITAVLNTEKTEFLVPKTEDIRPNNTVLTYIALGFEHILIGLDHLLFVACLVYISGTRKKLLLTITGFTVAHSITLFLASTGLLTIPIPPVEAVIALSIVFLAWEIARNKKNSLSLKYPILVSSTFGLLHGFGFASVLADIGLPQSEKVLALLCFNIGVELGQLLFVIALFCIFWILSQLHKSLTLEKLRLPASYFCGTLATIWVIERLAAF